MATKTTEFGEASGSTSSKGYEYQLLIGAYYLVVGEAREIEYEVDGEDLSIINENPNRLSIEYIQVKYLDSGSFALANFAENVFPQFWDAFEGALEKHSEKTIYSTLITNVSWDRNLKIFIESCKKLKRGLTLSEIEKELPRTAIKSYQKMRKGKKEDAFQRFLFGLDINYSWTESFLHESLKDYMRRCQIPEPYNKLRLIKSHILEVSQGIITRRKVEELIGYQLDPIESVSEIAYTDDDIKRSLELLLGKRSKYEIGSGYPDSEGTYRDMTQGLRHAGEVIKFAISAKKGTSAIADESVEIINSDIEKADQNAQAIARLEKEIWIQKKEYTQRLTSIEKVAGDFDYKL